MQRNLDGGLGGNRTPDALLRTEALYPLSYEAGFLDKYTPRLAPNEVQELFRLGGQQRFVAPGFHIKPNHRFGI